jgi:Uma2 family endonuclease
MYNEYALRGDDHMTSIAKPNLEQAGEYRGLRMTADDFLALPESKCHYELVNGIVTMSPSPSLRHQEIMGTILVQVATFLHGRSLGTAVHDIDVRFDVDLVYRPDIIYLSAEKAARCRDRVTEIPDLIVEIISPDSRRYDHETKKHDYERFGVQEYWLIDPETRTLTFYRRQANRFVPVAAVGDRIASSVISGFELDLAPICALF